MSVIYLRVDLNLAATNYRVSTNKNNSNKKNIRTKQTKYKEKLNQFSYLQLNVLSAEAHQ
jgi:hypothetical protein